MSDDRFHERPLKRKWQFPQPLLKEAMILANSLRRRISRLGLEAWRQQVYGLIFCRAYDSPTMNESHYPEEDEDRVLELLEKLEKLEATSLVKLAVWKYECQMHPKRNCEEPFVHFLWFQGGWRKAKTEYGNSPSIDIISQRVYSFL